MWTSHSTSMSTILLASSILLYGCEITTCNSGHNSVTRKVLFIPGPATTHLNMMLFIARQLEEMYGHTSSIIITSNLVSNQAPETSSVEFIVSKTLSEYSNSLHEKFIIPENDTLFYLPDISPLVQVCEIMLRDKDLFQTLQERNFDIAVVDNPLIGTCLSTLPYKLSIPFIQVSRIFIWPKARIHILPTAIPSCCILSFTDEMTLFERFLNTLIYALLMISPDPFIPHNVVEKYAPERPFISNSELESLTAFYLFDQDILLDPHLPLYPNMEYVGGTSVRPACELTGQFKEFMDSASNGAVLISFGSFIRMQPYTFSLFHRLFHKYKKIRFVVKYGNKTEIKDNIMTAPWMPQNDILGHKNTKLFYTHCGINSILEAIYHEVPMVGYPFVHDQPGNCLRMQQKGYGVAILKWNVSIEALEWSLVELLDNPVYKYNIATASRILKDRPDTPSQRAAYWINHVMVYGSKHLRPRAADMPYYQFLMFDVLTCMFLLFGGLICSCRLCCRQCILKTSRSKEKYD